MPAHDTGRDLQRNSIVCQIDQTTPVRSCQTRRPSCKSSHRCRRWKMPRTRSVPVRLQSRDPESWARRLLPALACWHQTVAPARSCLRRTKDSLWRRSPTRWKVRTRNLLLMGSHELTGDLENRLCLPRSHPLDLSESFVKRKCNVGHLATSTAIDERILFGIHQAQKLAPASHRLPKL